MSNARSCGSYLTDKKTYDYLEYTTNLTLPTYRVSKGYNYINNTNLVPKWHMPVIFSKNSDDLLSIPIDVSDAAGYRDFTFTELDTVNKKLVSLIDIFKDKTLRYYVKVHYRGQVNNCQIQKKYSTRNKFKVLAYGKSENQLNTTSLTIKVNGTVEILNFTCDLNNELKQDFKMYVSYYGNKSIPLIIDYDDGIKENYMVKDGQNDLTISKNYSTFGQFSLKASLFNDIGNCQINIDTYSGISTSSSIYSFIY